MAADLHSDGRRASQSQVEQHQVGQLLLDESPVGGFVLCCSDDLGLRDIVTEDAHGTFQLEGHILYNDDFKWFHICLVNVISIVG